MSTRISQDSKPGNARTQARRGQALQGPRARIHGRSSAGSTQHLTGCGRDGRRTWSGCNGTRLGSRQGVQRGLHPSLPGSSLVGGCTTLVHGRDRRSDSHTCTEHCVLCVTDHNCGLCPVGQCHLKGRSCCTFWGAVDPLEERTALLLAGPAESSVVGHVKVVRGLDVVVFHAGFGPDDPRAPFDGAAHDLGSQGLDDVAPVYCRLRGSPRSQARPLPIHNSDRHDWQASRTALPLQARRRCRKGCTQCCDSGFLLETPISAPPREPLDPSGAGRGFDSLANRTLISWQQVDDSRGHHLSSLECEARVPSPAVHAGARWCTGCSRQRLRGTPKHQRAS